MGLIHAALGSAGGVLADQWKDYFYCEALPADVLMAKGQKRVSKRSSNYKGSDNIISSGSVINVADGQCMIIVESGLVVDVCAEPGEYVYDASTEPSLFTGDLESGINAVFQTMAKRFTFGGEAPKDQRIYYFNTRELTGKKFGTPNPIAFRVVDERAGIDIDVGMRCFGTYSIRLTNPLMLYKSLSGNVSSEFKFSEIETQMRTDLLDSLHPAFAKISAMGIRYSAVMAHTKELSSVLKEELTDKWGERGIQLENFGIASLSIDPEDEKMLKELQRNAAFMDPTRAAAHMVGARAAAMQAAASNTGAGAAMAMMGMNMAGAGVNEADLFAVGAQQKAAAPADGWTCSCGKVNTGKFCAECGSKKPEPKPVNGWTCVCGKVNTGKFCAECGAKKPEDGWECTCGAVNQGKFCSECGAKKPAGVPQYKCDKCGWQPEDPTKAPKFCPECGDPFDDGDII